MGGRQSFVFYFGNPREAGGSFNLTLGTLTIRKLPEQSHPGAPMQDVESGMSDREQGDSSGAMTVVLGVGVARVPAFSVTGSLVLVGD